ncbi:MAG TPA: autotransporter domain-containing protein [Xanthobacteraceae bacterium]|nr:autotransporter domain-containing protein [Xanthobacteraceae bacterium]
MRVRVDRGQRRLLLASSSLAALLISGGAPSALAQTFTINSSPGNVVIPNTTFTSVTGSNVSVGGSVINTGKIQPASTGILIENSATLVGGLTNAGTITAKSQGIIVDNGASVLGGISNSGTISASHFGVVVGNSVASTTIATFGGGITNSGTISSANRAAIAVGGGLLSGSQAITVSNFSGGISNSGTVSAPILAIIVGGEAEDSATITVSTFSGGITNSGTGTIAGGDGIAVGGQAFTSAHVAISTFGGGITNAGTILASGLGSGIVVGGEATGSASLAVSSFSGSISNSGVISSGALGIWVGFSLTGNATGTLATFSQGITNSGAGTIAGSKFGILVGSGANGTNAQGTISNFSGGISNAGTVSGAAGIFVGGTGTGRATISTFAGGITNSGAVQGGQGILVGGLALGPGQITIGTFSGGIVNSSTGTVSGIIVGGTALSSVSGTHATVMISTFAGGIINSGTVQGGESVTVDGNNGIVVGGRVSGVGHITISTFTGGITNTGRISAGTDGIVVGADATIASFVGNISNAGLITAKSGIVVAGNATIDGAIIDTGTILSTGRGIGVGADDTINTSHTAIVVTGPTLTGGIANAGTISAGGYGIFVGGTTGHGAANVSSFSGNIGNSGRITAATGILVTDSTINGAIVDSGSILATNRAIAIDATSVINASHTGVLISGGTLTGGISNAGTISAAGGRGLLIGGAFNVGGSETSRTVTIATLSGGITNSGTIAAGGNGVMVGGKATLSGSSNHVTITVSTFAGGITNSGMIAVGGNGILVGGTANVVSAENSAAITISTFSGGISNSGIITASGVGIEIGGSTSVFHAGTNAASVTIATFADGITNSGMIGGQTGILINAHVLTFSGAIANSGTIIGSGGTAIDVSGANNAITINQSAGLISGAIKLSAHADVLNISGGTINGNIVGAGSSDTINFNMVTGTFTYGSAYGFTGINQVNINSGTVILNGANDATAIDVLGGALAGSGTLDPLTLTIHSGATFAPGTPGVPGTSMTVSGNLAFQSGALYVVYLNSTTTFANVSGTASLAGTVNANFATGSGLARQYTILESSGLGGTTFSGVATTGLPTDFNASLSYGTGDVFLNLTGMLTTSTPLDRNQQNVAAAIDTYFNNGGALPADFVDLFNLSGTNLANALSQIDGEDATGAATSTFTLMNEFLDLMFGQSGGGGPGAAGGGLGFAPDQQADALPPDVALAYDSILKAPPQQTFDQRWSTWGSGFGGSSFHSGNAAVGSNNVNATTYGSAAGMEYRPDPNTRLGFALAGSGVNWGLAENLGTGRSDAFQAGVYAKSDFGPAYVSGALAFGNNWFTTTRNALGDQLTASFSGQSYAARAEGGYRFALPLQYAVIGVTPYAALQTQWFHTPTYSETDFTGGGFGLTYASTTANDTRSELGARFDDLATWNNKPLLLSASLAWAHDWESGTALNAAFEALPGSAFTVNGAPLPPNSALTSASAQYFFTPNWSFIAKFDGEFAPAGQTYAGSGTLRYTW